MLGAHDGPGPAGSEVCAFNRARVRERVCVMLCTLQLLSVFHSLTHSLTRNNLKLCAGAPDAAAQRKLPRTCRRSSAWELPAQPDVTYTPGPRVQICVRALLLPTSGEAIFIQHFSTQSEPFTPVQQLPG